MSPSLLLAVVLAAPPDALPTPRPFDPAKPLLGTADRIEGAACALYAGKDDGKKSPLYIDDGETAIFRIRGADVELPLDKGKPFVVGGAGGGSGRETGYRVRDVSIRMVWKLLRTGLTTESGEAAGQYQVEITATQGREKKTVTATGVCAS